MDLRKRDLIFGISAGMTLGTVVSIVLLIVAGLGFELYDERSTEAKVEKNLAETTGPVEPDLTEYFDVYVSRESPDNSLNRTPPFGSLDRSTSDSGKW